MEHLKVLADTLREQDPQSTGILVATSVVAIVAIRYLTKSEENGDVAILRHPPNAHWFWGHELRAWDTPDIQVYRDFAPEFGFTYAIKAALYHPDIIITADPAALNHMFTKRVYHYNKGGIVLPLLERLGGQGLVWANGPLHKRLRTGIAPFFTHPQLREMEDSVYQMVLRFCDKIVVDEQIPPAGAPMKKVDMLPWISKVALDIIGIIAFSYDFGCGETEIMKYLLNFFEVQCNLGMSKVGYIAALVLRAFPWAAEKLFAFTDAQSGLKNAIKKAAGEEIVLRRKKESDKKGDLLDTLMQMMDVDDPVQLDLLLDQVATMIFAGSETSAKTVARILHKVAEEPGLQDAMREEIKAFVGSRPDGRPTYDEFLNSPGLKLLDAVIKEGLRHYPIANAERVPDEDDVIPLRFPVKDIHGNELTSLRVKKGQVFVIPNIVANTHPALWGEDGLKFDPYRWIEPGRVPPQSQLIDGVNGHFTFIGGTRVCVGYRLAVHEMKVIMYELIRRFEFDVPPGQNIQRVWSTTFQPFVEGERHLGARLPIMMRQV